MGKNYNQFVFKNLLKVHARRHQRKREYELEENNTNAVGNKKNDKFNKFKTRSDENIQMLIHQHSTKRFNRYEDLEK